MCNCCARSLRNSRMTRTNLVLNKLSLGSSNSKSTNKFRLTSLILAFCHTADSAFPPQSFRCCSNLHPVWASPRLDRALTNVRHDRRRCRRNRSRRRNRLDDHRGRLQNRHRGDEYCFHDVRAQETLFAIVTGVGFVTGAGIPIVTFTAVAGPYYRVVWVALLVSDSVPGSCETDLGVVDVFKSDIKHVIPAAIQNYVAGGNFILLPNFGRIAGDYGACC
jgi:hypothetical protein